MDNGQSANVKSQAGAVLHRLIVCLPREDWLVVGWVLGIKIVLFVFGAESFRIFENRELSGQHPLLEIWNRWDSLHYQSLARIGYQNGGVSKAFYPFFPWCVRFVSHFHLDYLVSAFVVSGIASVIAAILFRRLVEFEFNAVIARRAVWFFLIFPTAYFFHVGYSESLFLALALGAILAARNDRWWLAGMIGAYSWMTRPNGIVLLPTLGVEALHQWITTKRWQWRWLWIGLIPIGFGVYLLINWKISGDPFAFLRTRKESFFISASWPWIGVREAFRNMRRSPSEAEMVGAQEFFFAILGLACAIFSWIRLRPLYAMWITSSWILFTSVTFLQSLPRYSLSMFPIFMLFAMIAKNRFWAGVIAVWSLIYLALFAGLFARGWWAF